MIQALDYSDALHDGYSNEGYSGGSFYSRDDNCPFCKQQVDTVFYGGITEYNPENQDSTQDVHHSVTAKCCKCGWWTVEDAQTSNAYNSYALANWVSAFRGALRKFSPVETAIQMDALRRAIAKSPEAIDPTNPQKMEMFVASAMAGFWPGSKCKLCSKSGDGSMDLLLIIGDKPFAIRVLHKQGIRPEESVYPVTYFTGAVIGENIPNEIFVTSADRFPAAEDAARRAVPTIPGRDCVDSFPLVDRSSFMEFLEATSRHVQDVWRKCIPPCLLDDSHGPTPYSVSLRSPY
jgi:hypothetical protein